MFPVPSHFLQQLNFVEIIKLPHSVGESGQFHFWHITGLKAIVSVCKSTHYNEVYNCIYIVVIFRLKALTVFMLEVCC